MKRRILAGLILIGLVGCASGPPAGTSFGRGPSASSPLTLTPDGHWLWVANPDTNSVTRISTQTFEADAPIPVGQDPWAVAVSPSSVIVMNRASGSLSFIKGDEIVDELHVGPEPGGLALSPSGRLAYVTLSSSDEVVVVDVQQREVKGHIPVGRMPWSIAVTNDGDTDDGDETIIVTHRLARLRDGGVEGTNAGKEGWLSFIERDQVIKEVRLSPYDFGFVNNLEGLAIADDKVFIAHLLNSPDEPRDFKDTVSGAVSTVSLSGYEEIAEHRIHLNEDSFSTPVNFPRAIAVMPDGQRAYVVLAGTNAVMGIDLSIPEQAKLIGFWAVGDNPRGIVLNQDASKAYVMNYLSRDVSVLDLTDTVRRSELARIKVAEERLEPYILKGKILFNNANDPRLSNLGWMSCASCHLDGGGDGTTWGTPEGMRQTQPLWNLKDTAPFHASATRDEIQDFEHDIERFMDGVGLAPGAALPLLQDPNGGRSSDLDALAAFVLEGFRVPATPPIRDQTSFEEGRRLFEDLDCASCHGGPSWTRSQLPGDVGTLAPNGEVEVEAALHDVGTYNPQSDILGARGFDVPTLLGLHATAPYLHDGTAKTLEEVLQNSGHVGTELMQRDRSALSYFLKHLDESTSVFE